MSPYTLPYVDVQWRCNRRRWFLGKRSHTLRRRTSTDATCRTSRALRARTAMDRNAIMNEWMNEWMNEYDLSDAIIETVAGALMPSNNNGKSRIWYSICIVLRRRTVTYGAVRRRALTHVDVRRRTSTCVRQHTAPYAVWTDLYSPIHLFIIMTASSFPYCSSGCLVAQKIASNCKTYVCSLGSYSSKQSFCATKKPLQSTQIVTFRYRTFKT